MDKIAFYLTSDANGPALSLATFFIAAIAFIMVTLALRFWSRYSDCPHPFQVRRCFERFDHLFIPISVEAKASHEQSQHAYLRFLSIDRARIVVVGLELPRGEVLQLKIPFGEQGKLTCTVLGRMVHKRRLNGSESYMVDVRFEEPLRGQWGQISQVLGAPPAKPLARLDPGS